ncbi:secreted protein, putative, partial [Ixodes scapularis]
MKLVLFSLIIFFLAMLVDAKPGERRIDEDENYWQYQDIRRASLNFNLKFWMMYRTLRRTDRANECVYTEVKTQKTEDNAYEFVQGYMKEDGTNVEETLLAFPYVTESAGHKKREKENAMLVKKKEDAQNGKRYQLIYSDFKCCDILRVLDEENGAACELYLHDKCVSQSVPRQCESIYKNACGKTDDFKNQVYNNSCKNTTQDTT